MSWHTAATCIPLCDVTRSNTARQRPQLTWLYCVCDFKVPLQQTHRDVNHTLLWERDYNASTVATTSAVTQAQTPRQSQVRRQWIRFSRKARTFWAQGLSSWPQWDQGFFVFLLNRLENHFFFFTRGPESTRVASTCPSKQRQKEAPFTTAPTWDVGKALGQCLQLIWGLAHLV